MRERIHLSKAIANTQALTAKAASISRKTSVYPFTTASFEESGTNMHIACQVPYLARARRNARFVTFGTVMGSLRSERNDEELSALAGVSKKPGSKPPRTKTMMDDAPEQRAADEELLHAFDRIFKHLEDDDTPIAAIRTDWELPWRVFLYLTMRDGRDVTLRFELGQPIPTGRKPPTQRATIRPLDEAAIGR
jgi:hypothetical protein